MKTKLKKIRLQRCKFVLGSDLFEGLEHQEDLQETLNSNSNITWGDANRTLIVASRILEALDGEKGADELKKRVKALPEKAQTYVDLEN
jgi:DUF1009 family protein